MPKICQHEGCSNPIWSRKTMRCKLHLKYQNTTSSKVSQNVILKRKPVKKISDKQKKRNLEYLKVRIDYLNLHRNCQVCGAPATDLHHKASRLGDKLTDTDYFMAVCRPCHTKIETNREWAYEKGYLIKRLNKK